MSVARAVLLFFLSLTLATAGLAFARGAGSRLYAQWKRADADGDGRLSRSEARVLPIIARRFHVLDADRDGFISPEEVRAARAQSPARRAANFGATALLAAADGNGDGALGRDEVGRALPRLLSHFGAVDSDGDGRLSVVELERWLAARRASATNAQ